MNAINISQNLKYELKISLQKLLLYKVKVVYYFCRVKLKNANYVRSTGTFIF